MKEKLINISRLFLPLILGTIVGIIISGFIDYQNLIQPPLSPPKILFPIAWTILYLLMGLAYYMYRKNGSDPITILLYYLQLFFNLTWTIIFFVIKWRLFSIFWIIILIIIVIALIIKLLKEKKESAYLLIPYLLWLFFATYLNIGIYLLN